MKFGYMIIDNCLSVYVGRFGFTTGPVFLTLDHDGDIAFQIGKQINPMSDYSKEWHSRPTAI
jgi:hypothetical protein